ncbi:hypothetical protein ACE2AJ_17090 [Aquihabitans daechungensis]|uniref:hypothetical protein n=1 Tax=Aquihabitans daechungensis TaxID=1052257 RepID=UPI003BA24034
MPEKLSTTASGLDQALPLVSDVVVRLDERVERMDDLLTQVSGSVVGTINAVPGLRRVTRRNKVADDKAADDKPADDESV